MLSVIKTFAADRPLFVCLAHLLLLLALAPRGGQGSSLREHRLRGSEADPAGEHLAPNADMLKALRYIESLHQRSGAQQRPAFPTAERAGEAEKLRAVLRLASQPARSKEGDGGEEKEDKSEELLQAVLSTLQQTEKAAKPPSLRPGGGAGEPRDGAYPRKPPGIRPHQKLPLMFEDEEEGGREEEDEGPDLEQESPFKRTNENVEEKYTPQNLATLQSVFDELDKLTGSKTPHKRHGEEEEEEEDGDLFDLRDAAYDSAGGEAAEWGPLAEKEEEEGEEEEGEEDKQEASRGLDYLNDDEEDNEEEEEEEEGEGFPVKRSDDPDDVANMVDYYLLKVLEKTEEEQKRELEEEEEEEEELERAERRAAQTASRDGIDPRAVYQLIRISQKYQIPAENLLELLKMAEISNQRSSKPSRAHSRLSQMFSRRKPQIPDADSHSRRFRGRQKTPEEQRTEEVLSILGLGGGGGDRKEQQQQQQQHRSALARLRARPAVGRWGGGAPAQQRRPASLKANYDDSVDEDELAAYLATQMLAQYPKPGQRQNKAGQKREEGRGRADPLEQALQDYLDQMDSDKSPSEKRQSEDEERGEEAFDSGELMKLLSFLNPEDEESDAAAAAKREDGV